MENDFYVSETLFSQRPIEACDAYQTRVYDTLDALGIDCIRAEHDAAHTIECCAAVERVLGAPICKNLFLCNRQKTAFYLLLMPGDKPFKTRDITSQIQSARLSFAGAQDMQHMLGCTPGSASVLGLLFDEQKQVSVLIDEELLACEWIGFHPCNNTATLKLRMRDITQRFLPYCDHAYAKVSLPRYQEDV